MRITCRLQTPEIAISYSYKAKLLCRPLYRQHVVRPFTCRRRSTDRSSFLIADKTPRGAACLIRSTVRSAHTRWSCTSL